MAIQQHYDDEVPERGGQLNRAAVEDLKRFREELRLAHPNEMFEDSVELLRQTREERTRELEQASTP